MTTMMSNKYRGICAGCGLHVEAGEGLYAWGDVWCEEPVEGSSPLGCPRAVAQDRIIRRKSDDMAHGQRDRTFVSEFADVNEKIARYWAEIDRREADPIYQAERRARAEKRDREDQAWARQGLRRCGRCGGAGRSDRWVHTGSTCYECEGYGATLAD